MDGPVELLSKLDQALSKVMVHEQSLSLLSLGRTRRLVLRRNDSRANDVVWLTVRDDIGYVQTT